jgi:hypothetical protein
VGFKRRCPSWVSLNCLRSWAVPGWCSLVHSPCVVMTLGLPESTQPPS